MKIYLAGKIAGDPDYRTKFAYAVRDIKRRRGKDEDDVVINPATLPPGLSPADYVGITVPMLLAADSAVFLPDWKDSPGARIEHAICEYIGLPIGEIPDPLDHNWMDFI